MAAIGAENRSAPPRVLDARDARAEEPLAATIRTPEGRVLELELPAWRHRRIHLGMVHHATAGFFEVAHGHRPVGGATRWNSRRWEDSYLLGGAAAGDRWLDAAMRRVSTLCSRWRREVAIGPAVRCEANGSKASVVHSRWLWFDVDEPAYLPRLHAFLQRHPPHLHLESAGSGGEHAYWMLDRPQPAIVRDPFTGDPVEWIERAHARLIEHIGQRVVIDGRSMLRGADPACKDRSRVMRLAGTTNYKTGRLARIISANFALAPYTIDQLVGHLPDPETAAPRRRRTPTASRSALAPGSGEDPLKQIPALDYFVRIADREANRSGHVRCPSPHHEDRNPSCSVTGPDPYAWLCHSCGIGGYIYDLASAIQGGPTGPELRGAAFAAAAELVNSHYRRTV